MGWYTEYQYIIILFKTNAKIFDLQHRPISTSSSLNHNNKNPTIMQCTDYITQPITMYKILYIIVTKTLHISKS
jgi:hypothetical protein